MCRVAARNYKSTRAPRRGRARQRKGGRAAVAVHLGSCSLWEREDPPASTGGCEGMAVLGSPGRGGHWAPGVPSERGRRARVFHSPRVRLDARDNNEVVFCATGSAEIMYIAGEKIKKKSICVGSCCISIGILRPGCPQHGLCVLRASLTQIVQTLHLGFVSFPVMLGTVISSLGCSHPN